MLAKITLACLFGKALDDCCKLSYASTNKLWIAQYLQPLYLSFLEHVFSILSRMLSIRSQSNQFTIISPVKLGKTAWTLGKTTQQTPAATVQRCRAHSEHASSPAHCRLEIYTSAIRIRHSSFTITTDRTAPSTQVAYNQEPPTEYGHNTCIHGRFFGRFTKTPSSRFLIVGFLIVSFLITTLNPAEREIVRSKVRKNKSPAIRTLSMSIGYGITVLDTNGSGNRRSGNRPTCAWNPPSSSNQQNQLAFQSHNHSSTVLLVPP